MSAAGKKSGGGRQPKIDMRDFEEQDGIGRSPGAPRPGPRTLETQEPDKAGQALADVAIDPTLKAQELARALNIPEAMVKGFVRRVKTRYAHLKAELHNVQNKDIQDLLDDRLFRLLSYLDDDIMMQASVRDLAYGIDRLFNARQLLRGEPTAILSIDDRRALNQLVPALVAESRRRGLVLDQQGNIIHEPVSASLTYVPQAQGEGAK